jgi:hypothetical protein
VRGKTLNTRREPRRSRALALLSLLALLLSGGAACPPEQTDPPPAGEDPLADAWRNWWERCASSSAGAFYDAAETRNDDVYAAFLEEYFEGIDELYAWARSSENVRFDAAAEQLCIAELNGADCEIDDVCSRVFVGVLEEGAACEQGVECESAYCAVPDGEDCGVCEAPREENESCVLTGDDVIPCAADLYCDSEAGVCRAFGELGDACGTNLYCGVGLYCGGDEVCVAYPGENEACPDYVCADGLECEDDGEQRRCVDAGPGAEIGDSCPTVGGTCDGFWETGLLCDGDALGMPGTCQQVTLKDAGESCTGGLYNPTPGGLEWCRGFLSTYHCVMADGETTGSCERLPGPDEACAGFRCDGDVAYCDNETTTCVALIEAGAPCENGEQCVYTYSCTSDGDEPATCTRTEADIDVPTGQCTL